MRKSGVPGTITCQTGRINNLTGLREAVLQQRDSRIKEMENDIAAKTVVETPADYIPLQKEKRDLESRNEFLEARIRKLDKENGQLKRQLAELQRKQDPEQERLKKIHETVQLFSGKTEVYLKEMDKYAWLLDVCRIFWKKIWRNMLDQLRL